MTHGARLADEQMRMREKWAKPAKIKRRSDGFRPVTVADVTAANTTITVPANRKSDRDIARDLAMEIVKILRQNPAHANTYEYDRLMIAIAKYAQTVKENLDG